MPWQPRRGRLGLSPGNLSQRIETPGNPTELADGDLRATPLTVTLECHLGDDKGIDLAL